MANPQTEQEALLRQHRFALVSENKHLKYKDPEGRVYIVSKTPSDCRAWQNALTTLKRVIASPVPSCELLEEERQRRELEASIALEAQRKPCIGVTGAGKGKKSRGTGFIYEDRTPTDLTPEQIEQQERARRRSLEREAERNATRAVRRAAEEWNRMVGRCKKQVRQLSEDLAAIQKFIGSEIIVCAARQAFADQLREWRKQHPSQSVGKEERRKAFLKVLAEFVQQSNEEFNGEVCAAIDSQADLALAIHFVSGRQPRWFPPAFCMEIELKCTASKLRNLRRTCDFLSQNTITVPQGELLNLNVPQWLLNAVAKIHVGENITDGMNDWHGEEERNAA